MDSSSRTGLAGFADACGCTGVGLLVKLSSRPGSACFLIKKPSRDNLVSTQVVTTFNLPPPSKLKNSQPKSAEWNVGTWRPPVSVLIVGSFSIVPIRVPPALGYDLLVAPSLQSRANAVDGWFQRFWWI